MSTYAPAKAADLGGGCCADLEERVAELEATAARKGNRVVSLQIYGQVNKALLVFDNGVNSDVYVVDNQLASSRMGLKGEAKFKPGWSAGYNIEYEINNAQSVKVTDSKSGNHPELDPTLSTSNSNNPYNQNTFLLRQNYAYIESERLGRVSLGHQSTAGDYAYEVNLSSSDVTANVLVGNGFNIYKTAGTHATTLSGANATLNSIASDLDAPRYDVIRYDSPSLLGFILSASWGENDYADVALRFKREFNDLRVAAALAYQWDSTMNTGSWYPTYSTTSGVGDLNGNKFTAFGGSISVMHVPTGLYVDFAAAERDLNGSAPTTATVRTDTTNFWYLQGGIERKWLPYGATTLYGEYAQYDDYMRAGSEATRWGLGLNQKIDSAVMELYAHATFWSFQDGLTGDDHQELQDLSTVLIGSRIQF